MRFLENGHWGLSHWEMTAKWRAAFLVLLTAILITSNIPVADAAPRFAAVTVDARTGKLLYADDPDGRRHPASLTKMMTLYVLFQDLKAGKIKLNSPIRMSKRAASMAPSKLGVKPGNSITVETAIRALVVKSANDVAAAVAENLGGTESAFAQRMTRTARAIGMKNTIFANASGLPNPAQITTARDMATLGLRLMRDFPQYYPYFRTQSFVYAGRTIRGHNRLLGKYEGTDGIKTGYINASGFNLVSSVRRGDKRLVGVVLGGRSGGSRDAFMKQMLTANFKKATDGKMIAAVAGSSKGAINPVGDVAPEKNVQTAEATTEKGFKRPNKKSFFGKKETPEEVPEKAVAAAVPQERAAEPEQGDTDEDQAESQPIPEVETAVAEGQTIQQVGVVAAPESPPVTKVEEATLSGSEMPAKLPFAVKSEAEQLADQTSVASIPVPGDWSIQIGTYSSKADAQSQLMLLRKKLPVVLAGKEAQTVTIEKDGSVTYRARYIGFDEMSAAAACKEVKKKKSACSVQAPL
jgi:D-alanyl-D-alanine carboxypeptidase